MGIYQNKSALNCDRTSNDVWIGKGINDYKAEMKVADLKMVSFLMEVGRMDKIIMNKDEEEYMWAEQAQKRGKRLRWFGNVV